jgi:ABC-type sugar transport system ATPase subunit
MLDVKNLSLKIGSFSLKNINLTINEGEYFVLLGPSGNGKTVLLKLLAGLLRGDSGEIKINGKRVDHLPAEQRQMGYVFQDQVLFPHLSVYDNVAFGLRIRKVPEKEIQEQVRHTAEMLHASNLLD